ncbi:MAG TPA: type II secretion system F family protein, partial [Ramlibacter sp.]
MEFEVRALDPQRRVVSLSLDAPDASAAAAKAQAQGLAVLSARQRASVPGFARLFEQRFPLLQFTQELVAL